MHSMGGSVATFSINHLIAVEELLSEYMFVRWMSSPPGTCNVVTSMSLLSVISDLNAGRIAARRLWMYVIVLGRSSIPLLGFLNITSQSGWIGAPVTASPSG